MSSDRIGRPLAVSVPICQWKLSGLPVSSKPWVWLCFASLVILSLCPPGRAVDDINTILDKQEDDIRALADLVLKNYRDSSALAEDCQVQCSRLTCQPLTTDNFVCAYVPENPDCRRPDNSSCTSTMLDWDQSVVIGSPDANLVNEAPNCDMKKTICAQKQLDLQFFTKPDTSPDHVAGNTYFGSSNGILRTYPGKEWNHTSCSNYELRARPWYVVNMNYQPVLWRFVAATALAKDIVVMLDTGPSSGEPLAVNFPGITVFSALTNITSRMLKTLTYEDSISVFTLATEGAAVGSRVSVPYSGTINVNASIFETLNAQISNLPDPGMQSSMGQANLTLGLSAALRQFSDMPDDTSNLKIVIFLTTGDFTGEYLNESLVEDLIAAEVTVFIFRVLSVASSGGNDTVTTLLRNTTCVVKGGYGEQLYDPQDPYAILQPFYSYVARLRFDQNGQRPFWVTKFASFSAQGQVIGVAMPVFDGGVFLGVAARNIFVDNLQNETSNLNQILNIRNTVNTLQLINNRSITNLCNQTGVSNQSCPMILSGSSRVTGFCTNTNSSVSPLERLCCKDTCPWPFPGSGGHIKSDVLKIALPIALSAAFLMTATICVGCWWKRSKKKRRVDIRANVSRQGHGSSEDMFINQGF